MDDYEGFWANGFGSGGEGFRGNGMGFGRLFTPNRLRTKINAKPMIIYGFGVREPGGRRDGNGTGSGLLFGEKGDGRSSAVKGYREG